MERLMVYMGPRIAANMWAQRNGIPRGHIMAITEGDHRLMGLGYAPVVIDTGHAVDYTDRRVTAAMHQIDILRAIFGSPDD